MTPNRRQAQHEQGAGLQRGAGCGGASFGRKRKGSAMYLSVEAALSALRYVRSLPASKDGFTRPDVARLPLSMAKALAADGLLDLRGMPMGAHEVRLTKAALRMLAEAAGVRS